VERTASVLANLSRGDARQLIEEVKREQPEQGLALQSRLFTFESLLNADDRGVQEMLREVEAKRVALALKGAPEAIANKFFSNLSERAATMLKDEMEFLGQLRPEEQIDARRELVELALKLEADGRLTFAEVEGAGEGEDV
jgi:flagellar motor switch protein FliG